MNDIYYGKTDNQKVWISANEVCKALYKDETTCEVENTGCKWKHASSYPNEKNETVSQPAYCSNMKLYPN